MYFRTIYGWAGFRRYTAVARRSPEPINKKPWRGERQGKGRMYERVVINRLEWIRRIKRQESLRRTVSLTTLPSTVWPASFAMAAFMTRPMSLMDVAPVSVIASATARSTSA